MFRISSECLLKQAPLTSTPRSPTVQLGISAPQGCGKSTLVEQLELLFEWRGQRAASVSIDDFYLTNAVRVCDL